MQTTAEIHVALSEDGQLHLAANGLAHTNHIIALGMIERAKDLLLHPPQAQSPIAIVRGNLPLPNGSR